MIKLFAELNGSEVVNLSTVQQGSTYSEVYSEEDKIDLSKLQGYYVTSTPETGSKLEFSQEQYDAYIAEINAEIGIKEGQEMMQKLTVENILKTASDADAYTMRYLYDEWQPNTKYEKDDRKRYGDNLYKCKQAHTSEEGPNRTSDYLPALWDLIAPEDPTLGTKDNPIVIPEPFSSMEYIKGNYYKEGDALYLMDGPMVAQMEDGAKVSLTYKPSALVGQYFSKVEEE